MTTVKKLHQQAKQIVFRYKKCEIELIDILQQVDDLKGYYQLGYSSLFAYSTDGLGLSREVAYNFIRVARKAKDVPQLKQSLKTGEINISKARKIASVITAENHREWLNCAKTLSKNQLERKIAIHQPKLAVSEKMTYVHPKDEVSEKISIKTLDRQVRVQLQVGVSESLMLKLRQVQDILSQKKKRSVGLEEALEAVAEMFIEKNCPVKKAQRQKIRGKVSGPGTGSVNSKPKEAERLTKIVQRKPIATAMKHAIYLKYSGQCAHIDIHGKRCSMKRHLEIHHLIPLAKGGTDGMSNLKLLCAGHHKIEHISG